MAEVITPKRQVVFDRLRRRLESYRRRQSDCIPRYNQSFIGLTEQHNQDTLALKQRFLESKAKRAAKKTEKKLPDNSLQGLHSVTQFVPKRLVLNDDTGDVYGEGPPQPKQQPKAQPEALTKFSVEIVQQLEFTTSASNSQISTNVTVKALNTSVKSDMTTSTTATVSSAQPAECKQERLEDPEFVDLEQCAAALEKDAAAHGGSSFPGLSDLIGDETSDAIITSDAFEDLISEISDSYPFMNDFDFGNGDSKPNDRHGSQPHHHHPQQQRQHVLKTEEDFKSDAVSSQQRGVSQQHQRLYSSSGLDFVKAELSPAAQTLKQMAEQHQHKTQLGINFNPSCKSYSDFQYNGNDFLGSPQSNGPGGAQQYKSLLSQSPKSHFVSGDNIKQEVFSAQNSPGVYSPGTPRLNTGFKQQYSPYGSPGAHGSPQYTPRGSQGTPPQAPPSRPPSCPSSTTLQINQAQQLHVSQAQGQPPIQVSMAQNLCTEMKGSSSAVSVAAQQGLYMSSVASDSYCSVTQSQSVDLNMRHRASMPQQRTQDKMMHPKDKMTHPQDKMMHPQDKTMHPQDKTMHPQDKIMHPQYKMMHSQEKIMHLQEKMMHQQDKMIHPQEQMMQQQDKVMQDKLMQEKLMQGKLMHPQWIKLPQQGVRPPPPEYKAPLQTMPTMHPSMFQQRTFPTSQQSVAPSGSMMKPQGVPCAVSAANGAYLRPGAGSRLVYSRPQLTAISPEGSHLIMRQKQQQQQQPQPRPQFHQVQGATFRAGDVQMGANQMQHVSQPAQHQSLAMQHVNPQMSVNLQMQQSISGRQPTATPTSQVDGFPPSYGSGQYTSFNPPTGNDFNLDFLDHPTFSDQDFLSSFNLQDIL